MKKMMIIIMIVIKNKDLKTILNTFKKKLI